MKRKLFLVVLVAIVAMMFAACASSAKTEAPASPDQEKAVALFAEVNTLRADFLKQGKDLTKDPYGRAEAIYELSRIYMDKKMYTEALPGLGQCKTYYTNFLK